MEYSKKYYSNEQREWCLNYEKITGFDPHAMQDYEAGVLSFVKAAKDSIAWFDDWSSDSYLAITRKVIPGANEFDE